ncbi:hypothetical protein SISNIDRAFT_220179 [Sistotremastrum niveocremeum HHB9708]|uniref:Uncharacterized protein n=1 Tax=Sistotremastrum niveocremeum HHB9708 TaxID=1314777 RepID=A0A164QJK5_9AGAM|nr:hypothetical protein SISNIDRAFT_220179 [Sistotremastrum niveocremeum HHB9708]
MVVVMVTFGIATATFVLTMYNISTQLQPQSGRQGFEPRFSCNEDLNSRFLLPLFIFQMLVVDSFTIYRTWLLYKKKYSVIIFPCLCSMALFEVFLVYYFNLPLSLLLNACCTGFIAVRLIKIHFELKQPRGRLIWQFFVFSGIVYNLVLFFLFIGIFAGWADGMTLVGPIAITCTAAIAFDFLVLQIALTKAFNTHILVAREDSEEDSLDENHETREFNKAIAEFLTLQNELT